MNLRFARTSTADEALAYYLNRRGQKWLTKPTISSRSVAKRGRVVALEQRMKYSRSMMKAKHPTPFKAIPANTDIRTKLFFAKYSSNKERNIWLRSEGK